MKYSEEEKKALTKTAIDFLKGKTRDRHGRNITDILALTPDQMEDDHEWIQWAFPINTPSPHNPYAGQIFNGANAYFKYKFPISEQQSKLDDKFWLNLGLPLDGRKQDPVRFFQVVDGPYNHSVKRISRVLKHHMLTGKEYIAQAHFYDLLGMVALKPDNFSAYSIALWTAIVYDKEYYLSRHVNP